MKSSVKDDCEICLSYKDRIKDFAYTKHKVKYAQARIEYKKPISKEVVYFTVKPVLTTKQPPVLNDHVVVPP